MYKEVDCSSCEALCCRAGIIIPLSEPERVFMEQSGTELKPYEGPLPPGARRRPLLPLFVKKPPEFQVLKQDCANLTEGELNGGSAQICQGYEDRPQACREFSPGGYACRVLRVRAEIDTPEDLAEFERLTQS